MFLFSTFKYSFLVVDHNENLASWNGKETIEGGTNAMSKGPPYLTMKLQATHYLFWCISLMISKGRDRKANYSKEIFII